MFAAFVMKLGAEPLLEFMEECHILVATNEASDWRDRHFVATEKALLAPWSEVSTSCTDRVVALSQLPPCAGFEVTFPDSKLCEFDIRPILGRLGKSFGKDAVFFQDGMQAAGTGLDLGGRWVDVENWELSRQHADEATRRSLADTSWVLRVRWQSDGSESILGTLNAGLLVRGPRAEEVKNTILKRLENLPNVANVAWKTAAFPDVFTELVVDPKLPSDDTTSGGSTAKPPRVFISYAHEDEASNREIAKCVYSLAIDLREEGLETWIDQFLPHGPKQGFAVWMLEQVRDADLVLVVNTAEYRRKFETPLQSGVRLESVLSLQELYTTGMVNTKFIPVVFHREDVQHILDHLSPFKYYILDSSDGFRQLVDRLFNVSPAIPPVKPRNVKSEPPSSASSTKRMPWRKS
jgi:hypothetical protein